jgi:hypothetical protein
MSLTSNDIEPNYFHFLPSPTWVDINGDGDQDLFIANGKKTGDMLLYENIGDSITSLFRVGSDSLNPLDTMALADYINPAFVDIDNDEDYDLFLTWSPGSIIYYQNAGNKYAPLFQYKTGSSNPLNSMGYYATSISFKDINGDGDFDVFLGKEDGTISYYENVGSASTPTFQLNTSSSPFKSIDVGDDAALTFYDFDLDKDDDAFIGRSTGTIVYYENIGTSISPKYSYSYYQPLWYVNFGSNARAIFENFNKDSYIGTIASNSWHLYYYQIKTFGATTINYDSSSLCYGDTLFVSTQNAGYNFQWYLNGALYDNTTDPYSVITTSGIYNVVVDYKICMDSAATGRDITIFTPYISQLDSYLVSTPALTYQWYKDGVLLSGDTNQTLLFNGNGIYSVFATDSNGCIAASDTLAIITTFIEKESKTYVNLSPVPATEFVNIEVRFSSISKLITVSLFDINNKQVFSKTYKNLSTNFNESILLNEYSKGLYLIKISTEQELISKLIIKH